MNADFSKLAETFSRCQFTSLSTLKICIVTPDLLGPVRNGGIGTANTFLAHALADAGHQVNILFTQHDGKVHSNAPWLKTYQKRNISVIIANQLKHYPKKVYPDHPVLAMAYTVHHWLDKQQFDVVIFQEWQGHGFYALQAKKAGLSYQQTALLTITHSPSLWHALYNAELSQDPVQSIIYFIERKSIELCDALISPSAYMLDWLQKAHYKLPPKAFVQPNILNVAHSSRKQTTQAVKVDEIVFFGRLEYRKGLVQFCDALDRLSHFEMKPKQVTFLGKYARVGGEHSALYLARRSERWDFPIAIKAHFDQAEALAYLNVEGRCAVMPSVADNSPYTVYECLAAHIPFLARRVGGVAELIEAADRDLCLFDDNPNHLAQCFVQVLSSGAIQPRLAFSLSENQQAWCYGLSGLVQQLKREDQEHTNRSRQKPFISVCLVHYDRVNLLKQAIKSLEAQDYAHFEVILVDDGSPGKKADTFLKQLHSKFDERDWQIIRLENGYLGRARNTAVSYARGDYIVFMDDDNVAKPDMLTQFAEAARGSDADFISCAFDVFSGMRSPGKSTPVVERYLPVGDIVAFSVVANAIGDANSLIRKSLFEKLGGFSEDYGVGFEDFELFLRVVLAGANVVTLPETLFWYRRNEVSMLSSTQNEANQMRALRPFMEFLPAPLAEMTVMMRGVLNTFNPFAFPELPETDELTEQERQYLINGAPDSIETISAVSQFLMKSGKQPYAMALLNDINDKDINTLKASGVTLLRPCLLDIQQGNKITVSNLNHYLDVAFSNDIEDGSYFLLTDALLEQCVENDKLILHLLGRLAERFSDKLSTLLKITDYYLRIAASDHAFSVILQAMSLADREYCAQNADVEKAVNQQIFSNGFNHFIADGQREERTWPEENLFTRLLPELAQYFYHSFDSVDTEERTIFLMMLDVFCQPCIREDLLKQQASLQSGLPSGLILDHLAVNARSWVDQISTIDNPSTIEVDSQSPVNIRGWFLPKGNLVKKKDILYCLLTDNHHSRHYYCPIFQKTNRMDLLNAIEGLGEVDVQLAGFFGHLDFSDLDSGSYSLSFLMQCDQKKWFYSNTDVQVKIN